MILAVGAVGASYQRVPVFLAEWRLAREARGWRETQCQIEQLGCARFGKEAPDLRCRYRYHVDGRTYTGSRLTVGLLSHDTRAREALLARWEQARQEGRAVRCFVDPADPTRALLERESSGSAWMWAPQFAAIALMISQAVYTVRGGVRENQALQRWREAAAQGRPWDAEPEWRTRVCRPVRPLDLLSVAPKWAIVLMGAGLLGIVLPAWRLAVGALLPVAMAATLPWRAIWRSLQYRRWRFTSLKLAEVPFEPGGVLRAELVCREPAVVGDEMILRLFCSRDRRVGLRVPRYVRHDDATIEVRVPRGRWQVDPGGTTRIPMVIPIANLPGWQWDPFVGEQIYWQVEAWGGDVRGVDFGALFDVPVFCGATQGRP